MSHVPKFGNWEGDSVAYTAFFENARKEKSDGVRINPNDPEQNPDAFNGARITHVAAPRLHDQQKSHKTMASESSLYRLNNDDGHFHRPVSVPKFGQWDEGDPSSADGFTVIFNKVKEEKQIAATKFPPLPPHSSAAYHTAHQKPPRKKCCCLF